MGPDEIEFPQEVTFRVIAKDHPLLVGELRDTMQRYGIESTPRIGNRSANGTYQTWLIDATMPNLATMRSVLVALRALQGVRMVL